MNFTTVLQKALDNKLDKDDKHNLEIIINSTHKMHRLIDDLLEFSRVRRKELENSCCDMEFLVKNILKEQFLSLKRREYEIKISELYKCSCDSKMMEQVWTNLISNAFKYSEKKEKPVIEIGSFKNKGETVYFVRDNGIGFDMRNINKLFIAFQRLHSEAEFEGTGIGLAIVDRIIKRHGGRVWADAKPGEGASFYFSLPLSNDLLCK